MNRVTDPDVGPSIDAHLRREDAADQRDAKIEACEAEIFDLMMAGRLVECRGTGLYKTGLMCTYTLYSADIVLNNKIILAALNGEVKDPLRFIREHVEDEVRRLASKHAADRLRYLEENRNDY